MATGDFTVISLGGPSESNAGYLAEVHRRLAAQDKVRFRMHAMGTLLEGAAEDIFALVAEMQAVPFEMGVPRVYSILKVDNRRDRPDQTLEDKERSVQERLGGQPAPA